MDAFVRLILRHRIPVLVGLVAISLAAVASLSNAVIATSLEKMLLGESEAYTSYKVRAEEFGGDELLVVAYDDPDPLSEASLARLEQATGEVAALPEVSSVVSLLDAVELSEDDGMLVVRSYADAVRESPEDRAALTLSLIHI